MTALNLSGFFKAEKGKWIHIDLTLPESKLKLTITVPLLVNESFIYKPVLNSDVGPTFFFPFKRGENVYGCSSLSAVEMAN